jgi:predicted lactoylglutathione lyase
MRGPLTRLSSTKRPNRILQRLHAGEAQSPGSRIEPPLLSARKAGARIIKPGEDAFWGGYHGYFQDPDGHLWEIAWNPNPATAAPAGGPGVGEKATRSPD